MRCLKPMTLMTVVTAALFTTVLMMAVTPAVVVEASPQTAAKPAAPQAPVAAAPAPATPQQAPPTPQKGYVGTETCATCHTGYDTSINATKHGQAKNARTPAAAMGCESCHGPGEAHVND